MSRWGGIDTLSVECSRSCGDKARLSGVESSSRLGATVTPILLLPSQFRLQCDASTWSHCRSDQLTPFTGQLGQDRAMDAIDFSLGVARPGYNLFAIGPLEVAKEKCVELLLHAHARRKAVPVDWVYVHNFEDERQPYALSLPAGRGRRFRSEMKRFVAKLRDALPGAFEEKAYLHQLKSLEQARDKSRSENWQALEHRVKSKGFALIRTPMGMAVAPKRNGKVVTPDAFDDLPDEDQDNLQQEMDSLTQQVKTAVEQLPALEKKYQQRKRSLQRRTATEFIASLMVEMSDAFADCENVQRYFRQVMEYVVEKVQSALEHEEFRDERAADALQAFVDRTIGLEKCSVNLFVDHGEQVGAPVIVAEHPSHVHLFGRVEYRAQLGTWVTDHTLIKAGALHRASGGYLILDAQKLLQQPFVWEELKRVLRRGTLQIESLDEHFLGARPVSLEPESIPIDVKVALCGERWVHESLAIMDPEFCELFKVAADFEEEWPRTHAHELLFVRKIAAWIAEEKLLPFAADGLACVVEQSARIAGDAQKLTTREVEVQDLLRESDYLARRQNHDWVERQHVQDAIGKRRHRAARMQDRLREQLDRGRHLIDTAGQVVGQVNGLSVMASKGHMFGQPIRITARVWLGKGEIIDIEREAALAGPVHQKGVLILSGYLGQRYAATHPLSLCASLVFEQSYGAVEGDSATVAELIAILSAIAELPVHQGIAVTGSVNQHGEIQAVGEVNTKIEGFYHICQRRGLRSPQGVILPAANVTQLMLPEEIQSAAEAGEFALWPVRHVDEAAMILMSETSPLSRQPDPDACEQFHRRVEARLAHFSRLAQSIGQPKPD